MYISIFSKIRWSLTYLPTLKSDVKCGWSPSTYGCHVQFLFDQTFHMTTLLPQARNLFWNLKKIIKQIYLNLIIWCILDGFLSSGKKGATRRFCRLLPRGRYGSMLAKDIFAGNTVRWKYEYWVSHITNAWKFLKSWVKDKNFQEFWSISDVENQYSYFQSHNIGIFESYKKLWNRE